MNFNITNPLDPYIIDTDVHFAAIASTSHVEVMPIKHAVAVAHLLFLHLIVARSERTSFVLNQCGVSCHPTVDESSAVYYNTLKEVRACKEFEHQRTFRSIYHQHWFAHWCNHIKLPYWINAYQTWGCNFHLLLLHRILGRTMCIESMWNELLANCWWINWRY